MRFRLYHIILIIGLFFSLQGTCSNTGYNERTFDQEQIDEWKNDSDYNYDKVEPPYEKGWLIKAIEAFFEFFSTTVGQVLSIIVIIALILGLFYFISKSDAGFIRNKKDVESIEINFEEHIETIDYVSKIEEALQAGNFRIAVRFLYLDLLKIMSKKNLIKWEVDKTNHEYLREMRNHSLEKDFSRTTFLYEYSWYGDFVISEDTYRNMEPVFKKLNTEINKLN